MALPTPSPPTSPNDKEKDKKKEKEAPSSLSSTFKRTKHNKSATTLTPSATRPDNGLFTLRYEDATADKPPIPVILPPHRNPSEQHPALRRPASGTTGTSADDWKRDSGLAPTASTQATEGSFVGSIIEEKEEKKQDHSLGIEIDFDLHKSLAPLNPAPMPAPHIGEGLEKSETRTSNVGSTRWKLPGRKNSGVPKSPTDSAIDEDFSPITTPIPTEGFIEEEEINKMHFSKRGSLMWGGMNGHARPHPSRRQPSFSMLASTKPNMLTEELEKESQKVRSMYEQYVVDDGRYSSLAQRAEDAIPGVDQDTLDLLTPPRIPFDRPGTNMSVRTEHELAGGLEDWEDVEVEDVNRYGFIESRRKSDRPGTAEPRPVQRVSTLLDMASSAPRRKRTFGRAASSAVSTKKAASRNGAPRSVSQGSSSSQRSNGRIRAVSNHFPGNRDRRWVDEAGDMLTLPPGLADIAEEEEGGKAAKAMKRKEVERGEKWQKMAKIVKHGEDGKGMEFEFDPKNPKVIERTWKGIPDRWRGAAWYSFLAASAKKRDDNVPDEKIIKTFHHLQDQSSADDVQIDLDVPRTISQHIMFRKRYRGGQRLLFRVLHAVSLYFPDTGYVQGMASLAATLLCYYDEERAFVMLVRMFTLRSLGKLYESGFGGLMAALEEFKVKWLAGGKVSKKLDELNIEPTSWGTRWYLTLFNLSIPFAAQLRVWDIFMLLGDSDPLITATDERPFQGGLDILHATSAALIAATREILMDSDFENAMKVLTSFVPIKDEELLMKVTKAEWRVHRGKHRV